MFSFIILLQLWWPIESIFSTDLLFYTYVGIHQVRIVVFDNYQTCPVPLTWKLGLLFFTTVTPSLYPLSLLYSGRETSPLPHPRKRASINKTLPPVSKVAPKVTEPRNLKSWHHSHRKGCCLFEEHGKVVSHQYVLDVSTSNALWLSVKPLNLHPEIGKDNIWCFDIHLNLFYNP